MGSWRKSRRTRSLLTALIVLGLAAVAPVRAAGPSIALTLTASPKTAAELTQVTFHATATVTGGPLTTVWITLDHRMDSCEPVAVCAIDPGHTVWKFPELDGTTDLYAVADGSTTTNTYRIDVTACTPDCNAIQGSVTIGAPTLTASVTYSPSGQIMPGDTLHFTVSGSTNVGPVPGDLQTKIVGGLSDPTVVPPGGSWDPGHSSIVFPTTLDLKSTYAFDAVVTGAIGETVQLTVFIRPQYLRDGARYAATDSVYQKTFTFAIGPTPTKTPSPSKAPSPSRAPGSSSGPTPAASMLPSTAVATAVATSAPSPVAASLAPTSSAFAPSTAPTVPGLTQVPDSETGSPSSTSGPGPAAIVAFLLLAAIGTAAVLLVVQRRRRG